MLRKIVNLVRLVLSTHRLNAHLAAENLALRQQLAILLRGKKRPKLRKRDRIFWVTISRIWNGWDRALCIVQPDTVLRWALLTVRPPKVAVSPSGVPVSSIIVGPSQVHSTVLASFRVILASLPREQPLQYS